MEKKLKVELKQAKKNLDTWYSHGNCDDPETEEWLKGIIFGLERWRWGVEEVDCKWDNRCGGVCGTELFW